MQQTKDGGVQLSLSAELTFLRVATSFVEKTCLAFGLDEQEALSLTLATEELFAYLCQWVAPGKELRIACRSGGYYVEEDIVFEAQGFDMKAFNLTFSPDLNEEETAEETGLLIASRMVDRFQFFQEGAELRVVLVKEKVYPEWSDVPVPVVRPLEHFSVRAPDPEELKLFVRLAKEYYTSPFIPASFSHPGKVVDMAARGHYHSAISVDEAGHLGGGIVWRWEAQRLVEFYGPYLFNQRTETDMAQSLTETCLKAIARTRAIGLINRYPTPELDPAYFEALGSLSFCCRDGKSLEIKAYYRHLEEDPGLAVWGHPSLGSFLAAEYQRLVFARDIMPVTDEGESTSPYSVLSADFDRPMERVTFHPIWMGKDAAHVLEAHVASMLKEGITNILFEMDLGKSWQCHFTQPLLETGFEPRLVLPYAGRGDLIVFQHKVG